VLELREFHSLAEEGHCALKPSSAESSQLNRGWVCLVVSAMACCSLESSSGSALYFDARPLFKQSERGGVIQILLALFRSEIVDFFDGFQSG
jgi:hypothetical protein